MFVRCGLVAPQEISGGYVIACVLPPGHWHNHVAMVLGEHVGWKSEEEKICPPAPGKEEEVKLVEG